MDLIKQPTNTPPHITSRQKHQHQHLRQTPHHPTVSTTTTTKMATSTTATTSSTGAATYLSTFLNRTLHLHTTDGRMFAGQMKCTDPERNIILSMTHEYRQPSAADIQLAAKRHERAGRQGNVKVDLKKRFVGLVVVPGRFITRIEVEE